MSDTPETDAVWKGADAVKQVMTSRRLERERDEAKKDLEFRRDLFAVQETQLNEVRAERDEARAQRDKYHSAILECLEENRHLADGNQCTLIGLKKALL